MSVALCLPLCMAQLEPLSGICHFVQHLSIQRFQLPCSHLNPDEIVILASPTVQNTLSAGWSQWAGS